MRATRLLLGALGMVTALWGVRLLLDQGGENLRATALWLAAGVVLHDGVLAPGVIAVALVTVHLFGRPIAAPVIVGAVVLGTVTLVAIPVLGRYGARSDNPSLLDRDYTTGWFVVASLTVLLTTVTLLVRRRRGDAEGAGAG